jgi:uncharacterized membrane-anchored protein
MSLTLVSPLATTRRPSPPIGALRSDHVPESGLKYWLTLAAASVVGCNLGDLFAGAFGFTAGLPVLAAGFGATLFAERRATRPTEVYYWTAILLIRMAATNIADFLGHAVGASAFVALGAALIGLIASGAGKGSAKGLPQVDARYWAQMLIAGTIGTALGDVSSYMSGLGPTGATLALSATVAVLIAGRGAGLFASTFAYWAIVIAIRAAGTALGDLTASHIGLAQSTLVWGLVMAAALFFRVQRPLALAPAFA